MNFTGKTRRTPMRLMIVALLAAVALVIAGCSDSSSKSGSSSTSTTIKNAETVEFPVTLTSAESRLLKVGPQDQHTYGWNKLVGTATFKGQSISVEMLGNVDYDNGNGPFFGFVTLTTTPNNTIGMRMDGSATVRSDGSTALSGTFTVIGGTGTFVNVVGNGTMEGSRKAAVGSPVELVFKLNLSGATL